MEDTETELTVSESDTLGADFITVELDTQPIEYVVKWAEVGSKFTISCVKKDADDASDLTAEQLKIETDEAFFAPYEEVYPCEVTEQSVEIKTDSDDEDEDGEEEVLLEAGSSQLDADADLDQNDFEPNERQFRCNYCGKCYSHASSLYRHQQTHAAKTGGGAAPPAKQMLEPTHQDARYTCPHCGMSFKGSRMLGSHLRLHGKRRIHPCNICGKEFNHSSSLSRHRLIHKKGKGIPKDAALGTNLAALRHSLKTAAKNKKTKRQDQQQVAAAATAIIQSPGGDKFYACPQCDMSFRTSTQLSKHQVSHVKQLLDSYTPGKENLSESSSDLKIRLKLCSRDKPNFYTLCKKNRRRRGGRAAKRSSTATVASEEEDGGGGGGAGRHGCGQCGKRFSHASGLARHQQTHQAVGDSSAGVGGDGGGRRKQLHAKTKTYTCAACNKTFMHSSSFSRHKRAHLEEEQRAAAAKCRKRAVLDETAPLESDSE